MMKVFEIKPNDFSNYNSITGEPCVFIGMGSCDWKCCRDAGIDKSTCQNYELSHASKKEIPAKTVLRNYLSSDTVGVVLGGLEPLNDKDGLFEIAREFSSFRTKSDFVVYTGYTREEVGEEFLQELANAIGDNTLIFKFGRYDPNGKPYIDPILNVVLASMNQYGCIVAENGKMRTGEIKL